jgi:cell division protein FtsQ
MKQTLPAPLDVRLMNWTATVLFVGFAVLVLAVSARWVLRHPTFSINRIVVQGDLTHNNALTLRANAAHSIVGNFFTVDLAAARTAFESVPWVRLAQVRREYPGSLRVVLQEHDAVAYWGAEGGSSMVNVQGEVFEANTGDADHDDLPRLIGPVGHSSEMLAMYRSLQPIFEPLGIELSELELSARGGWRLTLDTDAVIELGGGPTGDVVHRVQRFTRTLTQVAAQYRRRPDALESADLRHTDGYAVRLRGVTVTTDAAQKAAATGNRR